jgi:simple sugar transport system permease protein
LARLEPPLVTVATAVLAAMLVASLLIVIYGQSPLRVYALMSARTFGDAYGFGQALFRATPLVCTGLAVAFAYRAGLFNIGAEGQLLAGSLAAALVGAALPAATPALVAVPACVLAAAAGGGALGFLPGALKARFGAHEVITTMMLNFVVSAFVLWLGKSHVFVAHTVHTAPVVAGARLGNLGLGGSAASWALVLAVLLAVAAHGFLARTRLGFELVALGRGAPAAEAAGISAARTVTWVMTASGAFAGLAATATVMGYKGYHEEGLGSGAGFMGIAVALLARAHPLGVVSAALAMGFLAQGALAASALVPKEILDVLQAVIVLAVAATSAAPGNGRESGRAMV